MQKITAIIVTHDSDMVKVSKTIDAIYPQVNRIIITDNASSSTKELRALTKDKAKITLIKSKENPGMTGGLNRGIRKEANDAIQAKWFLTMDDDTIIPENGIKTIMAAYEKLPNKEKKTIGILAFKLEGSHRIRPSYFQRKAQEYIDRQTTVKRINEDFIEKEYVITTGNIIKREIFDLVSFDENFVMDHIDTIFCMDIKKHNYRIFEYQKIIIKINVGKLIEINGEIRGYEPPERLYYITRNTTHMMLNYKYPFGLYILQHLNYYRTFVYVNGIKSLPKLCHIWLIGTYDGLIGKLGKCKHKW